MKVFEPGSPVKIGGDIEATVQQICIEHNSKIQYQVCWWDGKTRKLEWLSESEVRASEATKIKAIGFING